MKPTLFVRILTATLLPVFLVILIVIGVTRGVIYRDGVGYAKNLASLSAGQISDYMLDTLEAAATLQEDTSKKIANAGSQTSGSGYAADELLSSFLLAERILHSVWFTFEPGVFPEYNQYRKILTRVDGEIRETALPRHEYPEVPELDSQSGIFAFTDRPYPSDSDPEDISIGFFYMTCPIIPPDGKVIGRLGLSARYEDLLPADLLSDKEVLRTMLISETGVILFSSDPADAGNLIWNYGFQNPDELSQAMHRQAVWQEEITPPFSDLELLAFLSPISIPHMDRVIYLYQDRLAEPMYLSLYSSLEIIMTTGILGMLLLSLCVFVPTRSIAATFGRITNSFQRAASGGTEFTLPDESPPLRRTNVSELETLQNALAEMISQLRRTHDLKLKTIEAEVEREKLIASSEAKSNFFASMSHEIRTPMNAILGITEIMLYEGGLTPDQTQYIQDIKGASGTLLSTISNILDLSKLETGKMELSPEHYNFHDFMSNVVSQAGRLAAAKDLNFFYEARDDLPFCLYGDSIRLRQVLLNLIENSVKFTRRGQMSLSVCLQGDLIRFEVADTGIGIREAELQSVFESFSRIDTRRNRDIKGTGLGLSISKSLVELMGGTLFVKSVYGEGSVFSVTIPLILGDTRKLRRMRGGKEIRYSKFLRVLVVDDDKINLKVASGLFWANHGIRCDTANSGREAVSMVRQSSYHIIFMDHMMPEMDGVEATRQIRSLGESFRSIPIIALTANDRMETQKELIGIGMNDFLAKPIQRDMLGRILEVWVPEEMRLPNSADADEASFASLRSMSVSARLILEKGGVDTMAGLTNIGFDEMMYQQSLRLLHQTLPQIARLLDDLLKRQDMQEFHIHIHGLRGSLASIGAVALSDEARRLELAAQAGDYISCSTWLPPFLQKLHWFHEMLREAIPDEEPQAVVLPFDQALLNNSLRKLCAALEAYDYDTVVGELNTLTSMECDRELNDKITQIKTFADYFDYSKAIHFIRDEIL